MKIYKSIINVVGYLYAPCGVEGATSYELDDKEIAKLYNEKGYVTRESVLAYLEERAKDFCQVIDFYADIELPTFGVCQPDDNVIIEWKDEDCRNLFDDLMFG